MSAEFNDQENMGRDQRESAPLRVESSTSLDAVSDDFTSISMASSLSSADASKLAAARACVRAELRDGMRLGVGSGSTVKFLVDVLADALHNGQLKDIQCVPTSFQTRKWLRDAGLPVQSVDVLHELDVTIDGADEIDHQLNCIKGGGGCLLQEKLVQQCAKKFVLISAKEKFVPHLGTAYKSVPIEVAPYGWAPVQKWIVDKLGGRCVMRMDQKKCFPTITENHNYIFDWHFPRPANAVDWRNVHEKLIQITGVVETGLFVGSARVGYFGDEDGNVRVVNFSDGAE